MRDGDLAGDTEWREQSMYGSLEFSDDVYDV